MIVARRFLPDDDEVPAKRYAGRDESRALQIGIWDLEVFAGFLPKVLGIWNDCQHAFAFEMVNAAVPRAISKGGASSLAWAEPHFKFRIPKDAQAELWHNIVADRVYPIAEQSRSSFKFDLLVLLTPEMIAFSDEEGPHWNYFSWFHDKIVVVSAADVRDFAKRAERPIEAALAGMALAQLLTALYHPQVGFHKENHGCLFDFNDERVTLVDTIAKMRIEPECLETVPSEVRPAVERMVVALQAYHG